MMQAAKTPNADMRHVARRFRFCARKNVSGLRGVKDWAGLTLGLGLAASGILMLGLRVALAFRPGKRRSKYGFSIVSTPDEKTEDENGPAICCRCAFCGGQRGSIRRAFLRRTGLPLFLR